MSDAPTIGDILTAGSELLIAAVKLIETLVQERDRFRAAVIVVQGSLKPIAAGQWMITAVDVKKIVEALEGKR